MRSLSVLEARSLKSGFPLKAAGENPFLLFQLLVAPGIPWLMAAPLQPLLPFSLAISLYLCSFSSLMRTPVTGVRSHPDLTVGLQPYYTCKDPFSKEFFPKFTGSGWTNLMEAVTRPAPVSGVRSVETRASETCSLLSHRQSQLLRGHGIL